MQALLPLYVHLMCVCVHVCACVHVCTSHICTYIQIGWSLHHDAAFVILTKALCPADTSAPLQFTLSHKTCLI